MRGEVCHMAHDAALVAPYGEMSVGIAVVCSLLPSWEKGWG